jgi:hypothetical protein
MPAGWATSVPVGWQPVFFAASLPVTMLNESSAASLPAEDLSNLLVATELAPTHRYARMCLMADGSVRPLSFKEFDAVLALPQNTVFAKVLYGALRASTQPALSKAATQAATKPWSQSQPATASGPTRSSMPASTTAEAPSSSTGPVVGKP